MADQYEQNFDTDRQYVPPTVRVAAVYPATDGRAPESIDVELNVDADKALAAVERIIAALGRVAESSLAFATGGIINSGTCGNGGVTAGAPIGSSTHRSQVYLDDVPLSADEPAKAVGSGALR